MMQKILNGYKDYVVGNGILNLDKISFSAYMQTEQFQQLLASSMSELLADANLQEQFSAAMQTVMESHSAQISQALQSQLSTAMNTAMQQMHPDQPADGKRHPEEHCPTGQPDGKCPEDRRQRLPECHPHEHDAGRAG